MAKKKEKSQPQETPKSTEEEVVVPQELFQGVMDILVSDAEAAPGPLDSHVDNFGPLAPEDSDMAVALQHEGITPAFLARKLKIVLETYEPRWNQKERKWDYFVPAELWRRSIEMSMKVRGDYAPEKRIDINIDASLEDLLRVSKGVTPEEAKAKIIEYIDVEVIKGK